ncbi:MAG TPA: M48 family metalloprotease, partial [Verrucomicrobiae bacterium]|nr:M48 family metalloprotease [Verrucomicrobiae bacterium]
IVLETVNHFSPQPELLRNANDLAHFGVRVADYVLNQKGTLDPGELTLGLALVLLPGMLVTFGLWAGMLALFRHGGVGGTLASMKAREPNQADLKELQLADVAQEMAIAAGLPAPKIMLVDSIGANAAAVGTSPHDARIVISRRLLDDLDRDQLQAILAHLIGSIGNGDLGIAFMVTSVFETSGMLLSLINIPFDGDARRRVWRVVRYMLTGGTPEQKAADAATIAESLAGSLDNDPDTGKYFNRGNPGFFTKIYRFVLFPLMFTNMAINITLWMFLNVVLGPCMAMLWRTRRYLADATSVEFTRNPDALARALQSLSEDQTMLEGGDWATHLFVINPQGDSGLRGMQPNEAKKAELVSAWASTAHLATAPGSPAPASAADWLGVRQEIMATVRAARSGDVQAVTRLQEMARIAGRDPALQVLTAINPADAIAAMRGDPAALLRIQQMKQFHEAGRPKRREQGRMQSFASFHPPLAKRAKRLQKMGSHLIAPVRAGGWVLKVFMTLLYAIIVPLLTVAAGLMLIVIGMMIGMNLMLLAVWLMAIHWIFVWLNSR